MAKWEAIHKTWLDSPNGPRLVKEGEKLSYDGWPNAALRPVDQAAKDMVALHERARKRYGARKMPTPDEFRSVEKAEQKAKTGAAKSVAA